MAVAPNGIAILLAARTEWGPDPCGEAEWEKDDKCEPEYYEYTELLRSEDAGASWTSLGDVWSADSIRPTKVFHRGGGKWVVFGSGGDVWMRTSEDNGLTWQEQQNVSEGNLYLTGPVLDMATDGQGRWVVFVQEVTFPQGDLRYGLSALVSDDDLATWTRYPVHAYPSINQYVNASTQGMPKALLHVQSDTWLALWLRADSLSQQNPGEIVAQRSEDGGRTWSAPAVVSPNRSGATFSANANGDIAMLYSEGDSEESSIFLRLSEDAGLTFGDATPLPLEPVPGLQRVAPKLTPGPNHWLATWNEIESPNCRRAIGAMAFGDTLPEGEIDGEPVDTPAQLLQAFKDSDTDGDGALSLSEIQSLLSGFSESDYLLLDSNADGSLNVAELLAAAEGKFILHSGDTNGDGALSLNELLRVVQLYNAGGYSCLDNPGDSEDGYAPGTGKGTTCVLFHAADYIGGPDGVISLSELLRIIQFFASSGYTYCPEQATEDGFCADTITQGSVSGNQF
jgi:hypothetical protein